ncbi:MAG: hypothetical protein C4537_04440 [Acholeplasma sp.]|jgi:hypothetical protein|nr:MAG: hypothetical protein C4537_04440 [Acholeplasma sp.]
MNDHMLKRDVAHHSTMQRMFSYVRTHQQSITYILVTLCAIFYFIYGLGYSSNWALVVSETRGQTFYTASQQVNRILVDLGFVHLVLILIHLALGAIKRKKYYVSNFVLSILSSILMIVISVITLYFNSVLSRMYARITEEEVPAYLYQLHGAGEKSFAVFNMGNILSIFMIVVALFSIEFIIYKWRAQKERAKLIKELLVNHER